MALDFSLRRSSLTPELLQSLRQLNAIAAGRGQSLAQMSISWLLAQESVSSVIVGASSVAQLKDNLEAVRNLSFTAEELSEIDRISAPVQIR